MALGLDSRHYLLFLLFHQCFLFLFLFHQCFLFLLFLFPFLVGQGAQPRLLTFLFLFPFLSLSLSLSPCHLPHCHHCLFLFLFLHYLLLLLHLFLCPSLFPFLPPQDLEKTQHRLPLQLDFFPQLQIQQHRSSTCPYETHRILVLVLGMEVVQLLPLQFHLLLHHHFLSPFLFLFLSHSGLPQQQRSSTQAIVGLRPSC